MKQKKSLETKFFKFILVILFINLQFPFYIYSQNDLIFEVRKNLNKAKPFYLEFKQQVYDETELIAEESGNIIFVNINKLKWVYTDPEHKIFLIEKNNYQFYDKENSELTKGVITENRQKWIFQILFSDSIIDKIRSDKKNKILYIKHKSDDIDLTIYIGENGLPKKVVQFQSAGIKNIYHFKNYKIKYKYSSDIFDLKIPKNTEIIEIE